MNTFVRASITAAVFGTVTSGLIYFAMYMMGPPVSVQVYGVSGAGIIGICMGAYQYKSGRRPELPGMRLLFWLTLAGVLLLSFGLLLWTLIKNGQFSIVYIPVFLAGARLAGAMVVSEVGIYIQARRRS